MQSPGSAPPFQISRDRWCKHEFVHKIWSVCTVKGALPPTRALPSMRVYSNRRRKSTVALCAFSNLAHHAPLWLDSCSLSRLKSLKGSFCASGKEIPTRLCCTASDLTDSGRLLCFWQKNALIKALNTCLWTDSSAPNSLNFTGFALEANDLKYVCLNQADRRG